LEKRYWGTSYKYQLIGVRATLICLSFFAGERRAKSEERRALSSQAEGGFLMLEYQKSSAAFSLAAQLLVCVKFSGANTAVRS
jgi:hypothetical protein